MRIPIRSLLGRPARGISCLLLALNLGLAAAEPTPAGTVILQPGDFEHSVDPADLTRGSHISRLDLETSQSAPSEPVWRIEVTERPRWPTSVVVRGLVKSPVEPGDMAGVRFEMRTIASAYESGEARVGISAGTYGPRRLSLGVNLGAKPGEWRTFEFPIEWKHAFPAGTAPITFELGYPRQVVELRRIEVLSYPRGTPRESLPHTRLTYAGIEPEAAWRQQALERIERVRKSAFQVHVTDALGNPVPEASVEVTMIRHGFEFGSAVAAAPLVEDSANGAFYREKFLELFNAGTTANDLKWPQWIGEGGNFPKETTLRALRWLNAHEIAVRGHVFVWGGYRWLPPSIAEALKAGRKGEVLQRLRDHLAEISETTYGLVQEWDAVNEPVHHHDFYDVLGRDSMATIFQLAQAHQPAGVPLFLNEFKNLDPVNEAAEIAAFEQWVEYLIKTGAPLGGLGFQGHFGSQPLPPAQALQTLDRIARFGLPLRITEFDFDTSDEQLQAAYTRDFLIAVYSHPAVVGLQFWGFWERHHWRPQAALIRADGTERPAAREYKALVKDAWWTRARGQSDDQGIYRGSAFHGRHRVVVEAHGHRVERLLEVVPGRPATIAIALPVTASVGN